MSKHLLILTLATAALASGCRSGPNYNETPQPLNAKSFARQWATQLEGGGDNPVTAVHVVDQFVFIYRQDGTSSVLDRPTGRLLHKEQPRSSTVRLHPPVVLKDRIVYPTTTYLEVYDLSGRYIPHPARPSDESGKPFSQDLKFAIHSDVVGSGNFVFFGADFSGSGRAVEVDLTRPYVPDIWTLMTPGSSVSAAPAVSKDAVFIASEKGDVAAVTIVNREPLWTLPRGVFGTYGGVIANLVHDSADLYVASTDTKLYCLAESGSKGGRVKWQFFAGQALRQAPVVTKTMVYQVIPGSGLAAIEKPAAAGAPDESSNRQARWVARDATQFLSEDENYAYAATGDGHIAGVDKKTGDVRFVSKRKDFTFFGVNTTADGLVYVADSNARVMAVRPVLQGGGVGEIVMTEAPRQPLALAR